MTDAGSPPYPAPPSNDFGPPSNGFGPPSPYGSPGPGSPGSPGAPGVPGSPRRRSMALRHVVSPLVALVAAPIGLALVDYGAEEYRQSAFGFADSGWSVELLWLFAGGLVLMVAALSARLSGLGPVLAAIVWGLAPFLWFVSDASSFFEFCQDLPSTHFWFGYAPVEFPMLGALLLGAGIAGRWRGRVVPS